MKNIKTPIQVEIIFRGMNLEYDQDYADLYDFGKESENNMKVHWQRRVVFDNVKAIKALPVQDFKAKLSNELGEEEEVTLPNMKIVELNLENGKVAQAMASEEGLIQLKQFNREGSSKHAVYFDWKGDTTPYLLSERHFISFSLARKLNLVENDHPIHQPIIGYRKKDLI